MKRLAVLLFLLITASQALCEVTAKAYRSDGITPLELADPCVPHKYRDIMVGTELVIVIESDTAETDWLGAIGILDANSGVLYGRGDELYPTDSILVDAGKYDGADIWKDTVLDWFDMTTGWDNVNAGDWFVFDYNAIDINDCNVGLYYYLPGPDPWTPPDGPYLIHNLEFKHVPTRDFIDNGQVDFGDFSILAYYWNQGCGDPDWCEGADLDGNNQVDANDLMLFCEYWLEKTR